MQSFLMTKIISVGNMKGGVSKTTTAVELAQRLGKKAKTLSLDGDELWCVKFCISVYRLGPPRRLYRYMAPSARDSQASAVSPGRQRAVPTLAAAPG